MLSASVRITTADADVARAVRYLSQAAIQQGTVDRRVHFEIRRAPAGYVVIEDGEEVDVEQDALGIVWNLYGRAHGFGLGCLAPADVILHAGTGVVGGCRFVVIGGRGAGKTTLMTRLLYDGERADGDELAVLSGGVVTAFPRRFHLKPGIAEMVPEVAGLLDGLPTFELDPGVPVWGFDPSEAGFDWRIGPERVDLLVDLQPNHGGQTRLTEVAKHEMVRIAMSNGLVSSTGSRAWIPTVTTAVNGAACVRLTSGTLDGAVAALRDAAGDASERRAALLSS